MMKIPLILFLSLFLVSQVTAQLQFNFYQSTCPNAEQIVFQIVQRRFATDRSVTAALLRMHFHDCFVRGCDASILLDSTRNQGSEKDAGANQSVRGFELIDEIKANLEMACPNTVSCADIITLATRDSVTLAGGPIYRVPTGRRDGIVSNPNEVNLPGPTISVSQSLQLFLSKRLTLNDMIALLGGGHSVGTAHCSFFQDRLSNFRGTGRPDPTMNPVLVSKLTRECSSSPQTSFLDQGTSFIVDNEFYRQINRNNGVLEIDQNLALDGLSASRVDLLASNPAFFQQEFANSMVKMGTIDVLVGNAGQIRKNCRMVNN